MSTTTTKIATRQRAKNTNKNPKNATITLDVEGGTTEHAPSVLLDLGASDVHAEGSPVWIQIAKPGAFKGHAAGPFQINDQTFAEIVHNFSRTQNRRIPVDFEHASEQAATEGSIPTLGAPAQGWITKLEIRRDGLWGLCSWGKLARDYIRSGQYRYLSPAIVFGAKDRVTGKPIGARLSSVALTNNPFLDGLAPVTAKAPAVVKVTRRIEDEQNQKAAAVEEKITRAEGDEHEDPEDGATMTETVPCEACAAKDEKIAKLETEIADLRAKVTEHDERELTDLVANAKRWGATQSEAVLMTLARASKDAFLAAWPMIPPDRAYLMSNIATGPMRRDPVPDLEERAVKMNDAIAASPLPDIDHYVAKVEADAKAKGVTLSREEAYIAAHDARAEAAARLRREAGFG